MNTDIPPLAENNDTFYTNKEKANCLNNYFSNQSKVEGDYDPLPPVQMLNSQIDEIQILTEDVQAVIHNLDTSKAVGPDLIHNKLLVAAGPVIIEPLTLLFNKSLNEGIRGPPQKFCKGNKLMTSQLFSFRHSMDARLRSYDAKN